MSDVYEIKEDGKTEVFRRLQCANEDKDLQRLLELNLDLLPMAQLGMRGSAGWLLIKREMPVPSPETGENTWSLDFLLADDKAIPTLVECKRFSNTQARREIVGQLFEYAANGRSYWTKKDLLERAEESAGGAEMLRMKVEQFSSMSLEDYFEQLTANLKSSTMRLIFFLENSSNELRSVVEFLSEQFTDLEIFLVEAQQYERAGLRIVVPRVFGYTEESRVVRKEGRAAAKSISSKVEGENGFWEALEVGALTLEEKVRMRSFLEVAKETSGCEVSWGRGPRFIFRKLGSDRYVFALRRGGVLEWNFVNLQSSVIDDVKETMGERVLREINDALGTTYRLDGLAKYPQLAPALWLPKSDKLQQLITLWSE